MNIMIESGSVELPGILNLPDQSKGLVIFSHGSGSSRFSPRNTFVARELNKAGYATLLFDLLTVDEDAFYENRFDLKLLAERLTTAIKWAKSNQKISNLPIALFGASTGSAACIMAASIDTSIKTIISRGGRPDLVIKDIQRIHIPVLFIVGELDMEVIEMNHRAYDALQAEKKLIIVPFASHLFEEPGTLEEVAKLTIEWLDAHLTK